MSEKVLSPFAEVYSNLRAIHGELYAAEIAHTANCILIAEKMMAFGYSNDIPDFSTLGKLLIESVATHNRVLCDEHKFKTDDLMNDVDAIRAAIDTQSKASK